MLLELIAAMWLVIDPNGTRTVWDVQPRSDQVCPGAQICPWEPKPGDPTDPNLYVRGMGGNAALAIVKKQTPELSPAQTAKEEITTAIQTLAADPTVDPIFYMRLFKISQITDLGVQYQQWLILLNDPATPTALKPLPAL